MNKDRQYNSLRQAKDLDIALKESPNRYKYIQQNYAKSHVLKDFKSHNLSPSEQGQYDSNRMSKSRSREILMPEKIHTPKRTSKYDSLNTDMEYSKRYDTSAQRMRSRTPSKSPVPAQIVAMLRDLLDDNTDKEIRVGYLDKNKKLCKSCNSKVPLKQQNQQDSLRLEKNEWNMFKLGYKNADIDIYLRKLDFCNKSYQQDGLPDFLRMIKDKMQEKNEVIENLKQNPYQTNASTNEVYLLKDLITDLSAKIVALERENKELRENASQGPVDSSEIENLQNLLNSQKNDSQRLKEELENMTKENKSLKEGLENMTKENKSLKEELENMTKENKSLKEELENLNQNKSSEEELGNLKKENISLKEKIEELEEKLDFQDNALKESNEKHSEDLAKLEKKLSKEQDANKKAQQTIEEKDQKIVEQQEEIAKLHSGADVSDHLTNKVEELMQEVESLKTKYDQESDKNAKLEKQLKEQADNCKCKEYEEKIGELEQKIAELEDQIEKITNEKDEEIKDLKDQIAFAQKEITRLNKADILIEKLRGEITQQNNDLTKKDEKVKELSENFNKLRDETGDSEKKINDQKKKIDELEKEIRQLNKKMKKMEYDHEEQIEKKNKRIKYLEKCLGEVEAKIKEESKMDKERIQRLKDEIEKLKNEAKSGKKDTQAPKVQEVDQLKDVTISKEKETYIQSLVTGVFDRFDKDGSDSLDVNELHKIIGKNAALKKQLNLPEHKMTKEEVGEWMKCVDETGDHALDRKELYNLLFRITVDQMKKRITDMADELFTDFDKNCNGVLSFSEFELMLKHNPHLCQTLGLKSKNPSTEEMDEMLIKHDLNKKTISKDDLVRLVIQTEQNKEKNI